MKTILSVSRLVVCGLAAVLLCVAYVSAADESADTAETMYQRGVAYVKAGNFKEGLKTFRTMQNDHPRSRRAVRGWEYIAVCENQLNDQYAAFVAYQKIWDDHKDFSRLSVITRNQMKIANHYLKYKQYPTAVEIFSQILKNAPYSEVAPAAQYSLAQAYIGKKDYGAAKIELGKVIQNFPASSLVDDAAYAIGYVDYIQSEEKDYDQTATANAIASFRQFIHDFPSSPKVANAREYITKLRDRKAASMFRTAQFYENVRANKAAEIMYKEVIEQYPDSTLADQSRTRIMVIKEGTGGPALQPGEEQKIVALTQNKESAVASEKSKRSEAVSEVSVAHTIKTPVIASAAETTIRTTPSDTLPIVPASIEVERKQTVTTPSPRMKKILSDPEKRKELKEYLKKPYLAERRRSRKIREEWQAQKVALLSRAKADADNYLGSESVASVSVAPDRTELVVKRTGTPATPVATVPGEWQPVKDLSVSSSTEIETTQDVTSDTTSATPKVYTSESTDSYSVDDDTLVIDLSQPETTETVEQTASLSVSTDSGIGAEVTRQSIPEGAEELTITETVEEWQPAEETVSVVSREPETTFTDPVPDTEETVSVVSREPERSVVAAADVTTPIAAAGLNIRAETTVTPPPVHDSEKAAWIAAEQLKEQQRALEARQGIDAVRKDRDDSEWEKRTIPAQGNVRTAKYDDEMKKELNSEYNIDELKQDYAGIFYIVQQGDAARQRGMFGTAKQRYGAALDRLLALKKRAPTWESDIINFRIKYCRDYMRKLD